MMGAVLAHHGLEGLEGWLVLAAGGAVGSVRYTFLRVRGRLRCRKRPHREGSEPHTPSVADPT